MYLVNSLAEAYECFKPYSSHRPAETVTIKGSSTEYVRFLHWDPSTKDFTLESHLGRHVVCSGGEIETKNIGRNYNLRRA